jgi:hypothetical protein
VRDCRLTPSEQFFQLYHDKTASYVMTRYFILYQYVELRIVLASPWYSWNIAESGVKHNKSNKIIIVLSHWINSVFRIYTYIVGNIKRTICIVFILQCQKVLKQLPNCLKRVEPSVVLIVFDGDIYEVRVYTATISYCRSTWIRYKKMITCQWPYLTNKISSQFNFTRQIESAGPILYLSCNPRCPQK